MAGEKTECGEEVQDTFHVPGVLKAGFTIPTFPTLAPVENSLGLGVLQSFSLGSTWWKQAPQASDLDVEPRPTTPPGRPTSAEYRYGAAFRSERSLHNRLESEVGQRPSDMFDSKSHADPDPRVEPSDSSYPSSVGNGGASEWLSGVKMFQFSSPSNAFSESPLSSAKKVSDFLVDQAWLWTGRAVNTQAESPPEGSSQGHTCKQKEAPTVQAPYAWYAGVLGTQVNAERPDLPSCSSRPRVCPVAAASISGPTLPRAPDDEEYNELDAAR